MSVYEFEGKRPRIDASAYISPEATIIGDVVIGKGCYIAPVPLTGRLGVNNCRSLFQYPGKLCDSCSSR